ncbi:MAG: hypothetical protein NZ455_10390 [Bacteroidia bacterium]|nr:hypothetical protein [Bacteroidia bacterium]MDW8345605.1 hypothetical protein [Bacteroidia bacterium]
MREACGGRASARCEAPCTTLKLLPRRWAGAAPLARSTPTLWGICAAKRPQGHAQKN